MALFNEVFKKASIYEMLFFNIKSVLEHPTLLDLKTNNPILYERWKYISKSRFNCEINDDKSLAEAFYGKDMTSDDIYEQKAIYYPEFSKIAVITYAKLYAENGQLKRHFQRISNENEIVVIETFMDLLHELSTDGVNSSPNYFPMFCGHNIINYDIPLLIKRYLLYRDKFETNKELPLILKNCLNAKPWESVIIDTVNVWKFNGNDYTPLMLIADYLNLKKTVDLIPLPELSKYYWKNVAEKPAETLEYMTLQSATQTNLVIQLMNELRQL